MSPLTGISNTQKSQPVLLTTPSPTEKKSTPVLPEIPSTCGFVVEENKINILGFWKLTKGCKNNEYLIDELSIDQESLAALLSKAEEQGAALECEPILCPTTTGTTPGATPDIGILALMLASSISSPSSSTTSTTPLPSSTTSSTTPTSSSTAGLPSTSSTTSSTTPTSSSTAGLPSTSSTTPSTTPTSSSTAGLPSTSSTHQRSTAISLDQPTTSGIVSSVLAIGSTSTTALPHALTTALIHALTTAMTSGQPGKITSSDIDRGVLNGLATSPAFSSAPDAPSSTPVPKVVGSPLQLTADLSSGTTAIANAGDHHSDWILPVAITLSVVGVGLMVLILVLKRYQSGLPTQFFTRGEGLPANTQSTTRAADENQFSTIKQSLPADIQFSTRVYSSSPIDVCDTLTKENFLHNNPATVQSLSSPTYESSRTMDVMGSANAVLTSAIVMKTPTQRTLILGGIRDVLSRDLSLTLEQQLEEIKKLVEASKNYSIHTSPNLRENELEGSVQKILEHIEGIISSSGTSAEDRVSQLINYMVLSKKTEKQEALDVLHNEIDKILRSHDRNRMVDSVPQISRIVDSIKNNNNLKNHILPAPNKFLRNGRLIELVRLIGNGEDFNGNRIWGEINRIIESIETDLVGVEKELKIMQNQIKKSKLQMSENTDSTNEIQPVTPVKITINSEFKSAVKAIAKKIEEFNELKALMPKVDGRIQELWRILDQINSPEKLQEGIGKLKRYLKTNPPATDQPAPNKPAPAELVKDKETDYENETDRIFDDFIKDARINDNRPTMQLEGKPRQENSISGENEVAEFLKDLSDKPSY